MACLPPSNRSQIPESSSLILGLQEGGFQQDKWHSVPLQAGSYPDMGANRVRTSTSSCLYTFLLSFLFSFFFWVLRDRSSSDFEASLLQGTPPFDIAIADKCPVLNQEIPDIANCPVATIAPLLPLVVLCSWTDWETRVAVRLHRRSRLTQRP